MFQNFDTTSRPDDGPARLAMLRAEMAREGLAGYLVPRADAHQGEYTAAHDARLAWLTGFTGSAGFCAALKDRAGVFIDGRYRLQVKAQVDLTAFTPVPWPETSLADWLRACLPAGGVIGFDPWLHTADQIEQLRAALPGSAISFRASENLIDRIWPDQPALPSDPATVYPEALAGEASAAKRTRLGALLKAADQSAAVLTLPDSIAWLLNIRGDDLPCVPVALSFAILHQSGVVELFIAPEKLTPELRAHLSDVTLSKPEDFGAALDALTGLVRLDKAKTPILVADRLHAANIETTWGQDPCILPKARKNATEIAGARAAHLRDGAAMVNFLAWLDTEAEARTRDPAHRLTEIDVVRKLEGFRRATGRLLDISFETIAGAGPNGAIVHYRVTEQSNRRVAPGTLLLVDSGGQYLDGTTDITRTIAIGAPTAEHRTRFTRVLQGMIAIASARFPKGLAGRDLDALARAPLWRAGLDYDHGTGHGVGTYLSVHEGPQRLSRTSEVPLEPGMILSDEPGYYREGAYGIRIENLLVVEVAPPLAGADARDMLSFATLTLVPIDRRLIVAEMLTGGERDWLNAYHRKVAARIGPRVAGASAAWLKSATTPI